MTFSLLDEENLNAMVTTEDSHPLTTEEILCIQDLTRRRINGRRKICSNPVANTSERLNHIYYSICRKWGSFAGTSSATHPGARSLSGQLSATNLAGQTVREKLISSWHLVAATSIEDEC